MCCFSSHLFSTFLFFVVCFSHSAYYWLPTRKITLHGSQSRSWSTEQEKENKRRSLAAFPPPSTAFPTLFVRRKIIKIKITRRIYRPFAGLVLVKFVGCTSRGHTEGMSHGISHFSSASRSRSSSLDVPAGVTQEECHIGFLIRLPSAVHAFIFLARRIQPFLPSSTVKYIEFGVLTI